MSRSELYILIYFLVGLIGILGALVAGLAIHIHNIKDRIEWLQRRMRDKDYAHYCEIARLNGKPPPPPPDC